MATDDVMLLAAIRAQPAERTPMLAFMDWADEHDETVRAWIVAAVEEQPDLTANGVSWRLLSPGHPEGSELAKLWEQRQYLLRDVRAFAACLAWLATCEKRQTVNHDESSYGYKHRVERATGEYVANGTFIAAAIHAGFAYRVVPRSPNTLHGISKRSLKEPGHDD